MSIPNNYGSDFVVDAILGDEVDVLVEVFSDALFSFHPKQFDSFACFEFLVS